LGKWRSTEVKSAPTNVKITTEGQNGITIEFPSSQAVSEGKFDGKDYVSTIAGAPSKQTVVFEKLAPNAFKMTTKLDGKPIYVDVFTVSDDGKTLTDDGNPSSAHEPMKAVYEKQ
jgi:type V secretory pathway adhesin AidA